MALESGVTMADSICSSAVHASVVVLGTLSGSLIIAIVATFSGGITSQTAERFLTCHCTLSSCFRRIFAEFFSTSFSHDAGKHNKDPCERSSLLIMVGLNYLKHSNCLEYGQVGKTAPAYVNRNMLLVPGLGMGSRLMLGFETDGENR